MSTCLTHCEDFSFLDDLNPSLAVKNLIGSFGSYIKGSKEVTWQILTVAAKFKKIDKFFKNAVDTNEIVPGELKNIGKNISPKPDTVNLSHKFLCALNAAYPDLDRKVKEMIIENPLKLGHHSFIDTVATEVSSIRRILVAQCIINFVSKTD